MATHYGAGRSTSANNALTQGAGARASSTGEGIRYFRDSHTIVLASWADGDQVRFGPFRAGEAIIPETLLIVGDGTTDLGDDIDVGWAYVDGTGTADPNAFADAINCSAANIDVAGLNITENNEALLAPPTNDRDWWLTFDVIDATDEAIGPFYVSCFLTNFR